MVMSLPRPNVGGKAACSQRQEGSRLLQCWRHIAFQVLGAALIVLVTNWFLPFTQPSGSDDSWYLLLARDIKFEGGRLYQDQSGAFLHSPPGYPWLLNHFIGRHDLGQAPFIQRAYHGLTISICSIWATTMFGVGVGWLVFGLLALNPALVASSGMLSSEAPHAPLYLLGFLAWFQFVKAQRIWPLLLSALCLALSAYVRAYGLLLIAFLPLLILIHLRHAPWQRIFGYVAAYMTCWVLVLAPWALRNYQLFDHFVPMTISGRTVYSAWFPPGPKQLGMMAHDEITAEAGKIADPFERDRFYLHATVEKILSNPGLAVISTVRKYVFYLMPFDWEFFGRYNERGRKRPSLHFVYVFLSPFALLYIWHNRRNEEFWVGYMSPILFGLMMTGLVYGSPRFRLCIEPFLTIYAAAYLLTWIAENPSYRRRLAGGYLVACSGGAYVFALLVQ